MNQIFGEFIEGFSFNHQSLELILNHDSLQTSRQWQNISMSALFLANYCANLLPIDESDPNAESLLEECKGAIAYISNELLENAIKFNETSRSYPIKFGIHILKTCSPINVVIFTQNTIHSEQSEQFQTFIQKLLSTDTQQHFIEQAEKTADDPESEASGLGLLTIVNDYSANLGWKFEPSLSDSKTLIVTTTAAVNVSDLSSTI